MNRLLFTGILTVVISFSAGKSFSQELNCLVKVNKGRVETTETRIFEDMEKSFSQFMNTRKWTNDTYKNFERINCFINITLTDMPSIGYFKGTVQIQASRPIYGTNYESIILNFGDRDWDFEYTESLPLEFNENSFVSNLTSMLAYYAYVIIGLDSDTFSKLGGNPYFEKANNIVTMAQQANRPGWNQLDGIRNRYWLVENLQNPQMSPIREGNYIFHREALDVFAKNPDEARKKVLEALQGVQKVHSLRPNSILTISFFDAKSDEIVHILSKGDMQIRRESFEILKKVDPNKTAQYEKILKD
jgi:hypothetical protein